MSDGRPLGPAVPDRADPREQAILAREAADAVRRDRRLTAAVATWQVLLLAALLAAWWGASGRLVDHLFLSDPLSVASAFGRIARDGTLWFNLRYTLTETLVGYALGASTGLLAAVVTWLIPGGEPVLRPLLLLAYATPKIALAPLMILWFGIGLLPKILLAAVFVFFIVFFNTLAGLATAPPGLVQVVRVMRLVVSTLNETISAGIGHGAKNGPPPTPSVKLVVLESVAVIIPVIWLGSSSTADAVKAIERGGAHAPEGGPPPVLLNEPGTTVTVTFCPTTTSAVPLKLRPDGIVKPLLSIEYVAVLANVTSATPPKGTLLVAIGLSCKSIWTISSPAGVGSGRILMMVPSTVCAVASCT